MKAQAEKLPPKAGPFAGLSKETQKVVRYMLTRCSQANGLAPNVSTHDEQVELLIELMDAGWLRLDVKYDPVGNSTSWKVLVWDPSKGNYQAKGAY
jgi:hypothetical protein